MTERWTRIQQFQKTMRSLKTNSARGPLAQIFIGDEWHVPGHIDLTQDRKFLTWEYGQIKKVGHQQKNAPTLLLERFTQLAEEGPQGGGQDVLEFARKYGMLYLCRKHDRPSSHHELENPRSGGSWIFSSTSRRSKPVAVLMAASMRRIDNGRSETNPSCMSKTMLPGYRSRAACSA